MPFREDPGPCPICGAAHCACGGPTVVAQLPQRDAMAARALPDPSLDPPAAPAGEADAGGPAPLGDGSDDQPFSTATYRGKRKRGGSSRS